MANVNDAELAKKIMMFSRKVHMAGPGRGFQGMPAAKGPHKIAFVPLKIAGPGMRPCPGGPQGPGNGPCPGGPQGSGNGPCPGGSQGPGNGPCPGGPQGPGNGPCPGGPQSPGKPAGPGTPPAPPFSPGMHKPPFGQGMPPVPPVPPFGAGMHKPPFGPGVHKPPFSRERLLILISKHPEGIRQKAIADQLHIGQSSTSEMVDKLESDGYLVRRTDPSDKRATLLFLTELGQARAAEVEDERSEVFKDVFAVLTVEEKQTLSDLLDKLLGKVPEGFPETKETEL